MTVFDGDEHVEVHRCSAGQLRTLRRQRVAMVFQQFGLLPWRTVNDNVALGLELDGVLARQAHGARAWSSSSWSASPAGATSACTSFPAACSSASGLARAFATEAPILLMDEPFSALDPLIRVRLQDELLELQRKLNRTIIFVSHDLDEALKIGSRIAIMEGGEIVQVGTPQDIVLNPSSDYVRDFVAHMNPLNVLRAQEIMTPFAALPRDRRRRRGADRRGADADRGRARDGATGSTCRWWRWRTWRARRTAPSSPCSRTRRSAP